MRRPARPGCRHDRAALSGLPHLRVVFAGHVASALVVFLLFQRWFVQSVASSGVKG